MTCDLAKTPTRLDSALLWGFACLLQRPGFRPRPCTHSSVNTDAHPDVFPSLPLSTLMAPLQAHSPTCQSIRLQTCMLPGDTHRPGCVWWSPHRNSVGLGHSIPFLSSSLELCHGPITTTLSGILPAASPMLQVATCLWQWPQLSPALIRMTPDL